METPTLGVGNGVSSIFFFKRVLQSLERTEEITCHLKLWVILGLVSVSSGRILCGRKGRLFLQQEGFHVAVECLELAGVWLKGLLFVGL